MAEHWLVVDDLRTVGDVSYYAEPPEKIKHVTTCEDAKQELLLRGSGYDRLWLDHDLGRAGKIMPLVDWLCECAEDFKDDFVVMVHTANPVGAEQMIRSLSHYGYVVYRANLP